MNGHPPVADLIAALDRLAPYLDGNFSRVVVTPAGIRAEITTPDILDALAARFGLARDHSMLDAHRGTIRNIDVVITLTLPTGVHGGRTLAVTR